MVDANGVINVVGSGSGNASGSGGGDAGQSKPGKSGAASGRIERHSRSSRSFDGGADEGGSGEGPGRNGGDGDKPGDGSDDESSHEGGDEYDEEEEEAAEERVEDDDDEEEEVVEERAEIAADGVVAEEQEDGEVAGSSNPGSPAQEGNGWRSYDSVVNETLPAKSKEVYLASYKKFELYLKSVNKFVPNSPPSEIMILNYFLHLKSTRFWAPTSIWSEYSRLNAVFKRKFRFSMKTMSNVSDLLKSFEVGHQVKKSSVFTPQQVFYMLEHSNLYSDISFSFY